MQRQRLGDAQAGCRAKLWELETGDAAWVGLERSVRQDLGHLRQPRSGLGEATEKGLDMGQQPLRDF